MTESNSPGRIDIGNDARGIVGQTVIGATIVYGSVIYNNAPGAPRSSNAQASVIKIGPSPYKGLLAFQENDHQYFFGREQQVEDLWQKYRSLHEDESAIRFLTVYGPSGSGKSSLAKAGLIPALALRPLPGRDRARVAVLVPGEHPLESLATVLARIATNDQTPVSKTSEFVAELRRANAEGVFDGLRRIADALPEIAVSPLIVLVDQFEEVFNPRQDPSERDAFLGNLLCAAAERSKRVSVILTLRSDFLGATQNHSLLNQLIATQGFLVAAMTVEGLREAISKPAERAGYPLDLSTINLLIEQTEGREGALPLLQFTLSRIWSGLAEGKEPGVTLREIGGVGGALAGEAQRIYESLTPEEQEIARRVFLGLVQLGEGTKDTRRRTELDRVVSHRDNREQVEKVIARFASPGARLITLSGDPGAVTAEVTHETLFEHWGQLEKWLDKGRSDVRFHRRLEDAAERWKTSSRPDGILWRPPDLDLLDRFRDHAEDDLTPVEKHFADASRLAERERLDAAERQRKLMRGGLFGLGALSIFAFGVGGFAWNQLLAAKAAQAEQFEANHRDLLTSNPLESVINGLAAQDTLRSNPGAALQLSRTLDQAVQNNLERDAIPTGQGKVTSLVALPDGELVSGGGDGSLKRWGKDGQQRGVTVHTGQGQVKSLVALPDGELVSAGTGGILKRWRDGQPIGSPIDTGQGEVMSLVALSDGELVSGGGDGSLKRWGKDGQQRGATIHTGQGKVMSVVALPDGELISAGTDDLDYAGSTTLNRRRKDGQQRDFVTSRLHHSTLKRWGKDGQQRGATIYTRQSMFFMTVSVGGALAVLSDGDLVSAGEPIELELAMERLFESSGIRTVTIQNRRGKNVQQRGATPSLPSITANRWGQFGPKPGDWSSSLGSTIKRWRDGKPIGSPIYTGQGEVMSLMALPDGELVSGGGDGSLKRWSKDGQQRGVTIHTGQGKVTSLVALPDGELVSAGTGGSLKRWRDGVRNYPGPAIGAVSTVLEGADSTGSRTAKTWQILLILPDGERISAGTGGILKRWREGKPIGSYEVTSLVALPDGELVTGQGEVMSLVALPDGELVSGGGDGSLKRWSKDGQQRGVTIHTGQGKVTSLVALPDGELVSAGIGGSLKRWRDGKPIGSPIDTGQGEVTSLVALPDGELISSGRDPSSALGGGDGSLKRWGKDGHQRGATIHTGQADIVALTNGEVISSTRLIIGNSLGITLGRRLSVEAAAKRGCISLLGHRALLYPQTPPQRAARDTCRRLGVLKG